MASYMTFPDGFLRHERDVRRIHRFLMDRFHLDPALQDIDSAALAAYIALSEKEQQAFQKEWKLFLHNLN